MDDKEKQEISLIGRLLSLEALIVVMGIISLGYGIYNRALVNIFWGVLILIGAVVLGFVRKKDWKQHWAEQEELQRRRAALAKERKERDHDGN
ncbi:hypothetical protein GURASL_29850 [Geotalea uraniireducens]|uniref:Uncharacterized protein n=1 Tax=Geotalea uraniireducens TaxID=351604 RepID=A0ABM8EN94_9BACT|nr:hypothetical protein [Geotalea uraniireducens]BDV44062.1 hypothetical protein GURASL_29850 [Geotalea uraniireducens]